MEDRAEVRREDGIIVVVLPTEADIKHRFKDDVLQEFDLDPASGIADLSSTGFIDSAGLGDLVAILRQMKAQGHKLVLVQSKVPAVNKVFRTTGLDQVFPIVGTIEEAKANVAS